MSDEYDGVRDQGIASHRQFETLRLYFESQEHYAYSVPGFLAKERF